MTRTRNSSIHSYTDALAFWNSSKRRERIKLDHNTYLETRRAEIAMHDATYKDDSDRPEGFAVRLHDTDIVTFYANGDVKLCTGGWKTVTTRGRIRQFMPGGGSWPSDESALRRPFTRWSLGCKDGVWTVDCERIRAVKREPDADGYVPDYPRMDRTIVKSFELQHTLNLERAPRTAGGFRLSKSASTY